MFLILDSNQTVKRDTVKICTFLFGSNSSHSSKHFLIEVFTSNKSYYKIIDNSNIKDAIENFFSFIKEYNLSDSDKAILIRQLCYAY